MTIALSLACLCCLPAVWGCGHPSAASPAMSVAPSVSQKTSAEDGLPGEKPTHTAESSPPDSAASGAADHPGAIAAAAPESPPAAPAAGQRPPADRAPSRPGEAEKITFDDLNLGMQADVVFRPYMVPEDSRVKELEGKRVSIIGYMHGGQSAQRGIKEFILLKNNQCKFGPGGQADHLANVLLKAGVSTAFTPAPVKVEGTLKIEPFEGPDGNTWSIYRLEDAQIH